MTKRLALTVCGRKIGTVTEWDQADTFAMQIYNFVPGPGWRGPSATDCLSLDFEKGLVQTWNENGPVESVDLVTALADCPQDKNCWPK